MRKRTYFAGFSGPHWPDPRDLEPFFVDPTGEAWPREGGNESWAFFAEGMHGTDSHPDKRDQINVYLIMTGYPDLGVTFTYGKWDGRTKQKFDYASEGDTRRDKEIVYSMHGTPMSVGSFVSFADAYKVVKEFIETDGELPACIKWGPGVHIPQEAFFTRLTSV